MQLVVWDDVVAGQRDVLAAVIDPRTKTRATGPFPVSASATRDDTVPDVAWSGDSFLVVWEHAAAGTGPDVLGRRVSPTGAAIGAPFPIADVAGAQRAPAVAAGGSDLLVTWGDERSGGADVYANRVPATTGSPRDGDGFRVSVDLPLHVELDAAPDVAWNGLTFLVVWQTTRTMGGTTTRLIESAKVTSAGVPDPLDNEVVSRTDTQPIDAAVAAGADLFLVVWEDDRGGLSDLFGRRLRFTGINEGAVIPIATVPPLNSDPAVTYNRTFPVTWVYQFFGSALFATWVRADGTVQDPDGIFVAGGLDDGSVDGHGVTPVPGGRWDVAHDRQAQNSLVSWTAVAPK